MQIKKLLQHTAVAVLLLVGMLPFVSSKPIQAQSVCVITLAWEVSGQEYTAFGTAPAAIKDAKTGTAYTAIARYANCKGVAQKMHLTVFGGENSVDNSGDITKDNDEIKFAVTFSTPGSYTFEGKAETSAGVPIASTTKRSSYQIEVTQATGPNQTPTPTPNPSGNPTNVPSVTPSPSGVPGGVVATIQNPIPFNSIGELIVAAIRFILTMLGAVTVFFIVWGSVKMVISQGNESAIKSAKATIQWAVIGLVVALTSFSVIALVQSFLRRQ
ncbi:MAG: hypothetical protein KBD66_01700 [Candidatus Doudnabacteria bacterium]|nr:hypothetical protein [Candidatus Doudnabacteria bacterium]